MNEKKVEHVNGGEVKTFSAVKGQNNAARGPEGKTYADKEACAKVKVNKGE